MRNIPMLFHANMRLYKHMNASIFSIHIWILGKVSQKKVAVLLDVGCPNYLPPPSPQFGQLVPFF